MFLVGSAMIDDGVKQAEFSCDLSVCRGACCCLAGARGAPLEDHEVAEIERAFPAVRPYLSERSIGAIRTGGLVEGTPGDYATQCVDNNECVFVSFDGGIATCAFERAYLGGNAHWRKPLSCHLFPIRIRRVGQDFLRYDEIPECHGARARGRAEHVPLYAFLRESLIRKYGEEWYQRFVDHCTG